MEYPKLGDVISDDDGNFYVVGGRWNRQYRANGFISKYSPVGEHIKTTGFVGDSQWERMATLRFRSRKLCFCNRQWHLNG